ncbi:hypothetical protein DL771_006499 [Monosporascus sp. 5C6A]|nr:hypothetical protein DL771_006499 [Monosporascus sp. 5C6A]
MASFHPATLVVDEVDLTRPSLQAENVTVGAAHAICSIEDNVVSFEEYLYYAGMARSKEQQENARFVAARGPRTFKNIIKGRFAKGGTVTQSPNDIVTHEKRGEKGNHATSEFPKSTPRHAVTAAQKETANRALRTAGWGNIFYLVTTDILGPMSSPWAFAQLGYGPGVALYSLFGLMSYYSGWILWKVFLALDSDKYPVRGYGDYFSRIFGPRARHFINVAQSIQLLLLVSVQILSNGQSISQISRGPSGDNMGICFVACPLIFMTAGLILGQIRTLQRLGWLASFSVWLTIILCIIILVSAGYGPNYAAVEASFGLPPGMPIQKFAGTPPPGLATGGIGLIGSLNGLNLAVYAYGGSMLFAALLAEMRHPVDFWKSLLIAEITIYSIYMFFGIFLYSYHGQYAYNPAVQGISVYSIQTAANILNVISNLIPTVLYGNIGLKVVYIEVFHELFGFPELNTRTGKIWWAALAPVYWAIAFIIGASVPQFSYISGLVGALFILSFTYTFPAWLAIGFWIKKDAMIEGEERFDTTTSSYLYVDQGWKRWKRGFLKKPLFNTLNIIYFLGALVTCTLGCYSSIVSLRQAFEGDIANSLSCTPPL